MRETKKEYIKVRNEFILNTLSNMDSELIALMIVSASSDQYLESLYEGLMSVGEEE